MSYRLGYDLVDPATGEKHPLLLAGGVWHGDVFLYDFTYASFGLSGRIECDWRASGPRFHLDQGDASCPRAQAALERVAALLRPFFRGAFTGIRDEQLAALYPGDYHLKSGYADANPNPLEAEFKSAIADLVVRALRPKKLLDAGCAAGLLVREFRRRGVEAHGFDHCPDILRIAVPGTASLLRRGSVTSIPFGAADGFDTLTCIDVFEHVPEDRVPAMVAEFARLGVRNLAVHVSHCELEHFGHITLRPLSWWDAQLSPAFRRAQSTGGELLALPCPLDPRRVLRVYRRIESPIVLERPPSAATVARITAAATPSAEAAPAASAPR